MIARFWGYGVIRSDRKKLKGEYKQTPRRMGVYQVRNLGNDKVLIGVSLNLQGMLNRQQFQLRAGGHPNRELQNDWNRQGADAFMFEILDEITPRDEPGYDPRPDLIFLEDLWLEKLQPFGARGYNEPKKTREERLRMIARNRLEERVKSER
ncbi:MAG: GIY-YIG nuclease family protein [Blastocatellia bacterium]